MLLLTRLVLSVVRRGQHPPMPDPVILLLQFGPYQTHYYYIIYRSAKFPASAIYFRAKYSCIASSVLFTSPSSVR